MLQDKVIDIVSFCHDTFIGFGILVIIVSIQTKVVTYRHTSVATKWSILLFEIFNPYKTWF